MNNKRIIIALGVVLSLASAFAVNRDAASKHTRHDLPPPQETSPGESTVPDHLVYSFLFRNVVSLKTKIKELQAQGRIERKPTFPLQREAKLSEARAKMLEAIAFDCQQEVARQDEKAKIIMDRYRAQFPGNKIPEGVKPPPPPPELKVMWEERNAIVLRARDQLRAAFGEQEFHRFDQHVKFPHGADEESLKHRRESFVPLVHKP